MPTEGPQAVGSRLRGAVAGLLVAGAITAVLGGLGVVAPLECQLLDARIRAFPVPVDPQIAIIDLDQQSLARRGEWPWRRGVHAELIRKLTAWGARLIVFDVLFIGPSGRSEDDAALASAIRAVEPGRVVLASVWGGAGVGSDGVVRPQLDTPLAELQAAHGSADFSLDRDGAVRYAPPLQREDEPGLAFAALERLEPENSAQALRRWGAGGAVLPLSGGPQAYPTVSYANVLDGVLDARIDPDFGSTGVRERDYASFFRDRVVFVGASDRTLHDVFTTAATRGGDLTPGVELHASLLAALRRGNLVRVTPWGVTAAAVLLLMGLAAGAMAWLPWRVGLALGMLGGGLYALVGFQLFSWAHLSVNLATPLLALSLTLVMFLGVTLWGEEREKRQVRATFGRYVSPKVMEKILKDPVRYRSASAERRQVTVLFMDLTGFTGFVEGSEPERVQAVLNAYLREMTACIMAEDGILDKYIGDGIMAVWGSLGDADPARDAGRALRAAGAMQSRLDDLNRAWAAAGQPRFSARIGVHSGEALVGNFGSELQVNFTVVGDVVNTASRLEALNKEHGTRILTSSDTLNLAGAGVRAQDLGETAIRGRAGVLRIFAVSTGGAAAAADSDWA